MRYLIGRYLELQAAGDRAQTAECWEQIKQVDQGELYRHLQSYRLPRGGSLRLGESINRYVMIAILDYLPQLVNIMPLIKYLNEYCELRNRSVHEFAGVSEIQDQERLMATLKSLMKRVDSLPEVNPFDLLNQQICELLDQVWR